jgi:hypothetical protein
VIPRHIPLLTSSSIPHRGATGGFGKLVKTTRTVRILLALGLAGGSVAAMTGTAAASASGGCRYDYAPVGYGHALKPC